MVHCIGYWNTYEQELSLGKTILFLKELEYFVSKKGLKYFNIIIKGDNKDIYNIFQLSKLFGTLKFLDKDSTFDKSIINNNIYIYEPNNFKESSFFESSLFLQDKVKQENFNISTQWSIPIKINSNINNIINEKDKLIVFHLKNVKGTLSNANLFEWQKLVEYIISKSDKNKIFIIGNDLDINQYKFFNYPNVIITNTLQEKSILLDLSLILSADLFMGMSSGPCNVAIFSDVSYVVFKHPNHHAEQMKRELKEENKFIFQKYNQYFLMEYDNFEIMKNYFNLIDSENKNE